MSEKINEAMTKTVARQFLAWFLILCFTVLSAIFIVLGERGNILSDKIIGSLALTPLASVMIIIFKGKRDIAKLKTKYEHKEKMQDKRNIAREQRRAYKLKRLELKK